MVITLAKHERISLKNHQDFNERWLHDRIAEDPTILGLGDLMLIERERRQERAGRLDLLLADLAQGRRFEVEVQLGPTDESHIIRTIEYWDIERRRYPGYEHCAVLVAEDLTSRFLNVLGLLVGTIPLVVLQISALKVGEQLVLTFVKVLDQRLLRKDDEGDIKLVPADRKYWVDQGSSKTVELAEELLALLNQGRSVPLRANYNRYYIGVADGVRTYRAVMFTPRRKFVTLWARVADPQPWVDKLSEAGLGSSQQDDAWVRVNIDPSEYKHHSGLLAELLHQAAQENLE